MTDEFERRHGFPGLSLSFRQAEPLRRPDSPWASTITGHSAFRLSLGRFSAEQDIDAAVQETEQVASG
ncbi:hypothetical protein ACLGIH_00835 [Streptomyces sp. HMX87]|uniref:hypothetical protein n=1 Tax=Streptomyces sp. HMX87 TaxID=3390849 RepID=UPI003A889F84